MAGSRGRDGRT